MPDQNQLNITSDAFIQGATIPRRYTCDGVNINPPFEVYNIPAGTQTIAIIMEDPDAPQGTFTHWLAWNLPPDISIPEGRKHQMSGINSAGTAGYYGPCPPSGVHRYYFNIYALDAALSLENGAGRAALEMEIEKHVLAAGSLMGLYQRKK